MQRERQDNTDTLGETGRYVNRYGLEVLRQLPIEPSTASLAEVTITPDGFLNNDVSVSEIERRMKPNPAALVHDYPYLGKDESLIKRLAADNSEVSNLGLAHGQLANFLLYFPNAYQRSAEIDRGPEAGELRSDRHPYFDYNGRTYAFWISSGRGLHQSPFDSKHIPDINYDLICLETGQSIHYSLLRIRHIQEFGFYEGDVSTRLGPKKIAQMAGFIKEEGANQVAHLVQYREAVANLRTYDEFSRFFNLLRAGLDLTDSPNLHFTPENLGNFLDLLSLARYVLEDHRSLWSDERSIQIAQRIIEYIDDSAITPGRINVDLLTESLLTSDLVQHSPRLQEIILAHVESIGSISGRFDDVANFRTYFIENLLQGITGFGYSGRESSSPEYLLKILSKVELNPENLIKVYRAAADLASSFKYSPADEQQQALQKLALVINQSLPEFRERIISLQQQIGIDVTGETTVEDLLGQQGEWDKREAFFNEIIESVKFYGAPEGFDPADVIFVISALQAVLANPACNFEASQLSRLKELGVEPDLLPYALRRNPGDRPNIRSMVVSLYDGSARNEQMVESLLARLPSALDEDARKAAEMLIRDYSKYGRDELDINEFINRIVAEAEKREEQELLFEEDVLIEYLGLTLPPFAILIRSLTKSGVLAVSLNKWGGGPEMSLDREALERNSTEGPSGYLGPTRIVTVEGQEYVFDRRQIKVGDHRLNLSDARVATRLASG